MPTDRNHTKHQRRIKQKRWELLEHLDALTSTPMTVLAFVWLGLLILDLTRGLHGVLNVVSNVIWGLFIFDFVLEFVIAPHKRTYLRRNWLRLVALFLPALRVLRVFPALRLLWLARAGRSLRLLRLLASMNRGLAATRHVMVQRGVGYVVLLTAVLLFVGAAGMQSFENADALRDAGFADVPGQGGGLNTYGTAVWWTAMTLTTMGSDYFPKTPEGRILCWVLAVYAFAVFGFITATIASYLVARDPSAGHAPEDRPAAAELAALRHEVAALRADLGRLTPVTHPRERNGLADRPG